MTERRIGSRSVGPSLATIDTLRFVKEAMSLLAGTEKASWPVLESSTVTEGGEWENKNVRSIARFGDPRVSFVQETTHSIMLTDGVAGLQTWTTDPIVTFTSKDLPNGRHLRLREEKSGDGWSHVLEVSTEDPAALASIVERFERGLG